MSNLREFSKIDYYTDVSKLPYLQKNMILMEF